MVALQRTDIIVDITDKELSKLETTNVAEGQPDPLAFHIARQTARAYNFTARYVVDDETMTRLIVPLVIFAMAGRIGGVVEKWKDREAAAVKELEAIRDGKFRGIYPEAASTPSAPPPPSPGGGRSGSRRRVRFGPAGSD